MKKALIVKKLLSILTAVYIGACGYLYFFQRIILYLPKKQIESQEKYELGNAESIKLHTSDGVNITAWYIPAKKNNPTLVYFPGNSGNLSDRENKFRDFSNAGLGILAIDYRGYGKSEGSPSEDGLYSDARAAIKYLKEKGFKNTELILYGESLGTGVAVQMATENNYRAVILEAPYETIASRAAELYPYVPIGILLKDHFDSIHKIKNINSPVVIFHSKDDKVMPFAHGAKLFDAAKQPKIFYVFENAGHSNFNHSELATLVLEYTKNIK